MFRNLKAAFLLARSLKRIADALEHQNAIRETELLELHDIVIRDPKRKWSRAERESEVVYGEQVTPEEQEMVDDFTDV